MRRTGLVGLSSSSATAAIGIQYRRSSSPMGVPAPTSVSLRFCSSLSIVAVTIDSSACACQAGPLPLLLALGGRDMPGKVRRIVTAVNAAGRSYILSDTNLPTADVAPGESVRAGLWITETAPASNAGVHDPVPDGVIPKIPPVDIGGTVLRIIDFVPDGVQQPDHAELARRGARTTPDRSAKNPGFHVT